MHIKKQSKVGSEAQRQTEEEGAWAIEAPSGEVEREDELQARASASARGRTCAATHQPANRAQRGVVPLLIQQVSGPSDKDIPTGFRVAQQSANLGRVLVASLADGSSINVAGADGEDDVVEEGRVVAGALEAVRGVGAGGSGGPWSAEPRESECGQL